MPKKKKQIVWHKKRGKFIPPSLVTPHGNKNKAKVVSPSQSEETQDRVKIFSQNLAAQIKKIVKGNS